MYERFTDRARKVMQLSNQEAQRLGHQQINTGHILVAMAKDSCCVAASALRNYDIDLIRLRQTLEILCPEEKSEIVMGKLPQMQDVKDALNRAIQCARESGRDYVGTEHLLYGVITGESSIAIAILNGLIGLDLGPLRQEIALLLETPTKPSSDYQKLANQIVDHLVSFIHKEFVKHCERNGSALMPEYLAISRSAIKWMLTDGKELHRLFHKITGTIN